MNLVGVSEAKLRPEIFILCIEILRCTWQANPGYLEEYGTSVPGKPLPRYIARQRARE
jgi:hypothetical protein